MVFFWRADASTKGKYVNKKVCFRLKLSILEALVAPGTRSGTRPAKRSVSGPKCHIFWRSFWHMFRICVAGVFFAHFLRRSFSTLLALLEPKGSQKGGLGEVILMLFWW